MDTAFTQNQTKHYTTRIMKVGMEPPTFFAHYVGHRFRYPLVQNPRSATEVMEKVESLIRHSHLSPDENHVSSQELGQP